MKDNNLFKYKLKKNIYIILGSDDEIVPISWSIKFAEKQNANLLLLKDDHRFSKNINNLPELIKQIINQNN